MPVKCDCRGSVWPHHTGASKLVPYIDRPLLRRLQQELPSLQQRYRPAFVGALIIRTTVRALDEATIRAYIENPKWNENDHAFKQRLPSEP